MLGISLVLASASLGQGLKKDALATIHTIQAQGFPQCQLGLYHSQAWGDIATAVVASTKDPIVLLDTGLSTRIQLQPSLPVVTTPPGRGERAEWCLGWILLVDTLEELESTIDLIRFEIIIFSIGIL